jgi:hypothetical protein
MEPKMQTSFIPKKPMVEAKPKGSGISLFLLLSVIIFIVSASLAGAIFVWKDSLVKKIETDKAALVAARSTYEEKTIEDLIRLDERLKQSNVLLSKHIAVSPVFTLLEKNILRAVRIRTMKFSHTSDGKIRVDLSGTAQSYEALSKQSEAFGDSNLRAYLTQPVISDFNLSADGGVSFNFTTMINPNLISYSELINQR